MTIQYTPVSTDPNPRSRQRTHPARRLPQIITRWRTTVLLLILAGPLSLLLLSVVTYITPSNQYMRPCLPFSIHRISTTAHRTLSCQSLNLGRNNSSMSTSVNEADLAGSRLAGFLQSQKELFFGDLKNGNGKGWTVAVGNEAGGTYLSQRLRSKLTSRPGQLGICHRPRLPLFHPHCNQDSTNVHDPQIFNAPPTRKHSRSQTRKYPF
jgi:hypothetical protein